MHWKKKIEKEACLSFVMNRHSWANMNLRRYFGILQASLEYTYGTTNSASCWYNCKDRRFESPKIGDLPGII